MIKNPLPFLWTPYKNADGRSKSQYTRSCPWSRYLLPCATNKESCKGCYLYQKYATPSRLEKDGVKVVRYCDKCGEHIASTPLWVRIRTRNDQTVIERELCLACAGEIIDWLEKKEK